MEYQTHIVFPLTIPTLYIYNKNMRHINRTGERISIYGYIPYDITIHSGLQDVPQFLERSGPLWSITEGPNECIDAIHFPPIFQNEGMTLPRYKDKEDAWLREVVVFLLVSMCPDPFNPMTGAGTWGLPWDDLSERHHWFLRSLKRA